MIWQIPQSIPSTLASTSSSSFIDIHSLLTLLLNRHTFNLKGTEQQWSASCRTQKSLSGKLDRFHGADGSIANMYVSHATSVEEGYGHGAGLDWTKGGLGPWTRRRQVRVGVGRQWCNGGVVTAHRKTKGDGGKERGRGRATGVSPADVLVACLGCERYRRTDL